MSKSRDIADSAATINYIDGLTSDAQTQLNAKAQNLTDLGITATSTELNYVDGVTSAIQTQIDAKPDSLSDLGVTATATELNYIDGVTSSIQTQLDAKSVYPSQTGNSGKFLKTNGSATSWAEVSASPTIQATASGSLANGDKVIVNSDGTVSVIEQTINTTPVIGTPTRFGTNTVYPAAVFDSANNKVVIVYRDDGGSYYGKVVVGTVTGVSITFGTPVVFRSATCSYITATYDSNSSQVVIAYRDEGFSSYGRAIVGAVSGTSISFGSIANFFQATARDLAVCFDSINNKVVIAFTYTSTGVSYGIVGTVSGTNISFGNVAQFDNYGYEKSIAFDPTSGKVVIAFRDLFSPQGKAIIGTVSGTSISFGTKVGFSSGSISRVSAVYDSKNNKTVIAYSDSNNSSYGSAVVGTVSGTSISFGSAVVFESAITTWPVAAFDSVNGVVAISYTDTVNSNYGTIAVGTVSGTSISFNTPTVFDTGSVSTLSTTYDSNANRVVTAYNGTNGKAVAIETQQVSTTLTSENFIGISDGAYANAATANIQVIGSVDDAQSGLTAGQSYYVSGDGSLSTTPSNPSVFAGTALSSTKLLIKG